MTSKYRIRLSFETIKCTGCSAERTRGVVCPDCGKKPAHWEIDQGLIRRRFIVVRVLDALSADPPAGDLSAWSLVEQNTFGQLVNLVPVILAGLQKAAKSSGDGADLEAAATQLAQLRSTIHGVVHRRPYVALAQSGVSLVDHIEKAVRVYLQAFQAATILEAQNHVPLAQSHLDAAAKERERLSGLLDDLNDADTSSTANLVESVLAQQLARRGESLLDYFARAQTRVASLTGDDPEATSALQYLITEDLASSLMNRDQFIQTFVDAYQLLDGVRDNLAALATSQPKIVDDYVETQVATFNTMWATTHVIAHAQTTRQAVEGILNAAAELVESQGAYVARVLLLATGVKQTPYLSLKGGNATDHIRRARQETSLVPYLRGLDIDLRIAKIHSTIEYHADEVVGISKGTRFHVSHDDLGDGTLEGLESTTATLLAIRQVLGKAGISVDDEAVSAQLGLTADQLGKIAIEALSGCEATFVIANGRIEFTVAGDTDVRLSSLAAGVAVLDASASEYCARQVMSDGTVRVLEGPTSGFRSFRADGSEFEKGLQSVQVCLGSRLNGQVAITTAAIRHFCAIQAGKVLNQPIKVAGPTMRKLIDLAKQTGDAELERALRDGMRHLRDPTTQNLSFTYLLDRWIDDETDWSAP